MLPPRTALALQNPSCFSGRPHPLFGLLKFFKEQPLRPNRDDIEWNDVVTHDHQVFLPRIKDCQVIIFSKPRVFRNKSKTSIPKPVRDLHDARWHSDKKRLRRHNSETAPGFHKTLKAIQFWIFAGIQMAHQFTVGKRKPLEVLQWGSGMILKPISAVLPVKRLRKAPRIQSESGTLGQLENPVPGVRRPEKQVFASIRIPQLRNRAMIEPQSTLVRPILQEFYFKSPIFIEVSL